MPDDFFELRALVDLKLGYNALDEKWQARITKAFPNARIGLVPQELLP